MKKKNQLIDISLWKYCWVFISSKPSNASMEEKRRRKN